jgi:catechol-2,3-dioxygenase
VAIEVEGDEVIQEYRRRLQEAGVPSMYLDHGVFHSLYFNDPNGLNCEIMSKVRATSDNDIAEMRVARENLDKWTAVKRTANER